MERIYEASVELLAITLFGEAAMPYLNYDANDPTWLTIPAEGRKYFRHVAEGKINYDESVKESDWWKNITF